MMKRKVVKQEFAKILKRFSGFRQPGEVLPDAEHDPRSMKRVFPVYLELRDHWDKEDETEKEEQLHESLEVWKNLSHPDEEQTKNTQKFLNSKRELYNNMWARHFMHNWKPSDFALLTKLIEDSHGPSFSEETEEELEKYKSPWASIASSANLFAKLAKL